MALLLIMLFSNLYINTQHPVQVDVITDCEQLGYQVTAEDPHVTGGMTRLILLTSTFRIQLKVTGTTPEKELNSTQLLQLIHHPIY